MVKCVISDEAHYICNIPSPGKKSVLRRYAAMESSPDEELQQNYYEELYASIKPSNIQAYLNDLRAEDYEADVKRTDPSEK